MALIKCPECKKKVSDKCGSCPNCGYPIEVKEAISENNNIITEEKEEVIKEKLPKNRKPVNKKILIGIISAVIVLIIVGCIVGYNVLQPRINATRDFKNAVTLVEQKNAELETAISKAEELIAKKQPLLDETLVSTLENAISDTKAVKVTDFKKPKEVADIISRTEELNKTDYTEAITNLSDKHNALEINAKRYQLVNVPTEAYVIQCLKTIPEITGISAVTEDNDPNGNLNKLGGYTATVYFSHKALNLDKSIYGDTIIEQGTDGGGAIEVYTCVEDAVKRRDYLANFDGTITASGTHTVIGTVLVRTSDKLTASQQKELEAKLVAALTYLPEVDDIKDNQNEKNTEATTNQQISEKNKHDTESTTRETTSTTVNKNQQAVEAAEEIVDFYATVYPNMVRDLLMDDYGFTESQANYGVKNANIDWNYYAVIHLEEYVGMNEGNVTKSDAERYLGADKGYSDSTIKYALLNANIDWTATEQKKQDNNCLGHHMDVPTCKKPSTCIYCGYTEGEPIDCQYIDGVCHFCGDKQE